MNAYERDENIYERLRELVIELANEQARASERWGRTLHAYSERLHRYSPDLRSGYFDRFSNKRQREELIRYLDQLDSETARLATEAYNISLQSAARSPQIASQIVTTINEIELRHSSELTAARESARKELLYFLEESNYVIEQELTRELELVHGFFSEAGLPRSPLSQTESMPGWPLTIIRFKDSQKPAALGISPDYFAGILGEYLIALEMLQNIVDEIQGSEPTPVRIIAMWPGTMNIEIGGIGDIVRTILSYISPIDRREKEASIRKTNAEARLIEAQANSQELENLRALGEFLVDANGLELSLEQRTVYLMRAYEPLREIATSPIEIVEIEAQTLEERRFQDADYEEE